MKEFRETLLPLDDHVFKAFFAWRTNAQNFAERTNLKEEYPVQVAQVAENADRSSTSLMALAMLMAVPEDAWSVMENRFGKEMVDKLGEAWSHVRTGYAYLEEASDDVKGLAMAAAILAFNSFIEKSANIGETISMVQMGEAPQKIFQELLSPETKVFDRIGEKVHGTKYAALEDIYLHARDEYRIARKEQTAQLAEMGVVEPDEDDSGMNPFEVPFEMSGLYDAPEVRTAYRILQGDSRVDESDLAKALSVGRLMSDVKGRKDPVAIAAGIIDAGLAHRTPDDIAFLSKKLDGSVMGILEHYDLKSACLEPSPQIMEAPPGVRQAAVANGIVLLDFARRNGEHMIDVIDARAEKLSGGAGEMLKAQLLLPMRALTQAIAVALDPLMNKTGAPQLEQILIEELRQVKEFVAEHLPGQPQGNGGRIVFRRIQPTDGKDFGM